MADAKPMTPTRAKEILRKRVKGGDISDAYYLFGVEKPPSHGAVFSIRYDAVSNAREGRVKLRERLARKRVGTYGEVVIVSGDGEQTVVLWEAVKRSPTEIEFIEGDGRRSTTFARATRAKRDRAVPRRRSGKLPF